MTVKSLRPRELPLLGSNQDSPDPESYGKARLLGVLPGTTGERGAKQARTPRDSARDWTRAPYMEGVRP